MSDNTHALIKSTAAAVVATACDWKFFNRQNIQESVYFGASAGLGIYAGSMIGTGIASAIPDASNGYMSSKSVVGRTVEIISGSAVATATNVYILKNSYNADEIPVRMGLVALADFAGEAIADWYLSQPIGVLM